MVDFLAELGNLVSNSDLDVKDMVKSGAVVEDEAVECDRGHAVFKLFVVKPRPSTNPVNLIPSRGVQKFGHGRVNIWYPSCWQITPHI